MNKNQKLKIKEAIEKYVTGLRSPSELFDSINIILNEEDISNNKKFGNFSVGDSIIIQEDRNPIISYDGKPEGFPVEIYGKTGVIQSFDKKTMSQKNVFVMVDDHIYSGHISKIKKEK